MRVRYTDDGGTTKPLERGILTATVSGVGKDGLLGFGCAAPYNKIGFLAGKTDTYYGEALAVVRRSKDSDSETVLHVTDGKLSTQIVIPANA